jgi:hypothetical protein
MRAIGDIDRVPPPPNRRFTCYISNPFPVTTQSNAENSFGQALDKAYIQHNSVQCPLGASEKDAWLMRAYTAQFNAGRGYAFIDIDWKPPAGLGLNINSAC